MTEILRAAAWSRQQFGGIKFGEGRLSKES
jgi:hypothetical protein